MNGDVEALVRELKDRQDIHDCLVRYCRGVDRFDREMVRSAYHPDALDDHGDFVGGVEGFIDWAFDYHTRHQRRTMHSITTHSCELNADTAHTETYWNFISVNQEAPHQTFSSGRYIDRLERRNGEWRIAARVCVINGLDHQLDPQAQVGDLAFVPSTRDRSDPSYMRPLTIDRSRITEAR